MPSAATIQTSSSPPTKDDRDQWRKLYTTARWKRLRDAVLSESPLCAWCLAMEIVEPASVVHHKTPHKGDLELFWNGPFIALCKPHHDSHGQLEDHGKKVPIFGADGWPIE